MVLHRSEIKGKPKSLCFFTIAFQTLTFKTSSKATSFSKPFQPQLAQKTLNSQD